MEQAVLIETGLEAVWNDEGGRVRFDDGRTQDAVAGVERLRIAGLEWALEQAQHFLQQDDPEAENFSAMAEGRVPTPVLEAQSAAIARAMASICNDERGRLGVPGGHGGRILSRSLRLPNRRGFRRACGLWAGNGPMAMLACCAMIDLDGFKALKHRHDHPVRQPHFAATLRRHLRPADTIARQGGDEFALVLIVLQWQHILSW